MTITAGGSTVAGFGDAVDADWRSTGTCLIRVRHKTMKSLLTRVKLMNILFMLQRLAAGNTVNIRQQSGGGSDCVQETSWRYGRLSVYLIATY